MFSAITDNPSDMTSDSVIYHLSKIWKYDIPIMHQTHDVIKAKQSNSDKIDVGTHEIYHKVGQNVGF
jgi:hypothetical protein